MKKLIYIILIFVLPVCSYAQNVAVIKTSTQPEVKQYNNTPVLVIPKAETQNHNVSAARNPAQNHDPAKKVNSVRKIENRAPVQKNDARRKQILQPVR